MTGPNPFVNQLAEIRTAMRVRAYDSNTPLSQKRVLLNAADELALFSLRLTRNLDAALRPTKETTR